MSLPSCAPASTWTSCCLLYTSNHGTDFRFVASDVAVRRIEVLSAEPADYVQGGSDPSRFEELQTQIGEGMELTLSLIHI